MSGSYKITVLPGDGIGPEVTAQAVRVLEAVAEIFGHDFQLREYPVGGAAVDILGKPLSDEVVEACLASDAILFGAVGGPKWDDLPLHLRPEKAFLDLRKSLDLFANIRPIKVLPPLVPSTPLKEHYAANLDLIIVRELTGGIYFGSPKETKIVDGIELAVDTCSYYASEIERITRVAFDIAKGRKKKVASVDKANVLETSRLWRKVVQRVAANCPEIQLQHLLVDNCALQLVRNPGQFDVILTENMFGDIISEEAAALVGSIGLLASGSFGKGPPLYEPIHGTAPDIAGKGIANPIGAILCVAMMLNYSFGMIEESSAIENAITMVLEAGYRTPDIAGADTKQIGTREMSDLIIEQLKGLAMKKRSAAYGRVDGRQN